MKLEIGVVRVPRRGFFVVDRATLRPDKAGAGRTGILLGYLVTLPLFFCKRCI
jgi:hypothetical protein